MSSLDSKAASFDVVFSLSVFNLEALKRAAYVLMPRASVTFKVTNSEVRCTIIPISLKEDVDIMERDFCREVVDQDLRISIEARTEPIRNAILGLTFSRTGLQG